jgi:hypothetical protein
MSPTRKGRQRVSDYGEEPEQEQEQTTERDRSQAPEGLTVAAPQSLTPGTGAPPGAPAVQFVLADDDPETIRRAAQAGLDNWDEAGLTPPAGVYVPRADGAFEWVRAREALDRYASAEPSESSQ